MNGDLLDASVDSQEDDLFGAALASMHVLVVTPLQVMAERVAASLSHSLSQQTAGGVAQTGVSGFDASGSRQVPPEDLVVSFTGVSRVLEVLQRVGELYESSV